MINEMNDPSIASISECDMSSPLLSFSSTKALICFRGKALTKWPRKPWRMSSPLKLTKTSYFGWGALFEIAFSDTPFKFQYINKNKY
jgi:hypothetical protein